MPSVSLSTSYENVSESAALIKVEANNFNLPDNSYGSI